MTISKCRVCESADLEIFLDLGYQPYANALIASPSSESRSSPLGLCFCHSCSLVQLTYTADPDELFSNYLWVTGTSKAARDYAKDFYKKIVLTCGDINSWVCEVASNDGTFLRPFKDSGVDILGIDPAANIVKEANDSGIPTMCNFFSKDLAKEIAKERGHASVVFARNVLAHVPNPVDFMEGMSQIIGDSGIAVVEFHYGAEILKGLQYDSIYHEHLSYLTATTSLVMLKKAGLEIFEIEEGPISGGSLVLFLQKMNGPRSISSSVAKYLKNEKILGLDSIEVWRNYGKKVYQHKKMLQELLNRYRSRNLFGYGASARSSTLLNFCEVNSEVVRGIADANPHKHGLYTAGTAILIEYPDEVFIKNPDSILILAWNFKAEIISNITELYGFKGEVILPLPNEPTIISVG